MEAMGAATCRSYSFAIQGSREQSHIRVLTQEPLDYGGLEETLLS